MRGSVGACRLYWRCLTLGGRAIVVRIGLFCLDVKLEDLNAFDEELKEVRRAHEWTRA